MAANSAIIVATIIVDVMPGTVNAAIIIGVVAGAVSTVVIVGVVPGTIVAVVIIGVMSSAVIGAIAHELQARGYDHRPVRMAKTFATDVALRIVCAFAGEGGGKQSSCGNAGEQECCHTHEIGTCVLLCPIGRA